MNKSSSNLRLSNASQQSKHPSSQSHSFDDYYVLDKIISRSFYFGQHVDLTQIKNYNDFFRRNELFHDKIVQYLIQMIEGVCSTSFDFLVNDKCNENEAKCYASKNILENIKYLCQQLALILRKREQMHLKLIGQQVRMARKQQIDGLIQQIIDFICNELKIIVEEISFKYPCIPPSGYTLKLKNMIKSTDLRQDYAFDFFYLNQIKVVKPQCNKTQNQILHRQIMVFLNRVIEISFQRINQNGLETYYDSLMSFNRNLTWLISQSNITQENIESDKDLSKLLALPRNIDLIKDIFSKYRLPQNQGQLKSFEEQLTKFENNHKFQANSKISKNTQQYDCDQIQNAQLKIKNSAVLRVLTKWVEDIKETLQKSEKYIRDNSYKFKTNENVLVELDEEIRDILCKHIKKARKRLLQQKTETSNTFTCDILMQQPQPVKYNFQNSLVISSQLNSYIIKQTIKELINLLYVLFEIPEKAAQEWYNLKNTFDKSFQQRQNLKRIKQTISSVNLVCNRIGDLLRSKIYCTEPQFMKLLTAIYTLDKYCSSQPHDNQFFKLIRIKNKLKQNTNNVLLNYMFHGKMQCELQICFLVNKKDKSVEKTNSMHHYLYELTRGIYGIVPQLANIVNQKDPICIHNQLQSLALKKYMPKSFKFDIHKFEERILTKSQRDGYVWRCLYKHCKQFSLQGSFRFVKRQNRYYCIKCYLKGGCQNIYKSLRKLNYCQQDEWVSKLLQKSNQLGMQQISNLSIESQNIEGIYLGIYPTDKKVVVELYVVLEQQKPTKQFLIKPLDLDSKIKAKQVTEQLQKEHLRRDRLYIKINYLLLRKHIQMYKGSEEYIEKLDKKLDQINKIRQVVLSQINSVFIKKIRGTSQESLRLNDRLGILNQLSIQPENLNHIQRLYAENTAISNLQICSKFHKNIIELYLARNQIKGEVLVQNYSKLAILHLNDNQIQSIQFQNTPNLKSLCLNNNKLKRIKWDKGTPLQRLQIVNNKMQKNLSLLELKQLNYLNTSQNKIQEIDARDSPLLASIICSGEYNPNNQTLNILLNKDAQLLQIQAFNTILSEQTIQLPSFKTLEIMQIQIHQQNYQALFKSRYPNLKKLLILLQKIPINSFKFSSFLSQPKLQNIEIGISNCECKALDLSNLKKIDQLKINNYYDCKSLAIEELKLNCVNKIELNTRQLTKLTIKEWSEVSQFFCEAKYIDPLPVHQNLKVYSINTQHKQRHFIFQGLQQMQFIQLINTQNAHLVLSLKCMKNRRLNHFKYQNLNIKNLQIKNCPNIQTISLRSNYQNIIEYAQLDLPNVKSISLINLKVNDFRLKLSSKTIKEISFFCIVLRNFEISFYEQSTKMRLQTLSVSNLIEQGKSAALLNLIQSVQFLQYGFEKFQIPPNEMRNVYELRLSRICKKVKRLKLTNDQQIGMVKIIIDRPLQIIKLPPKIESISDCLKRVSLQFEGITQLQIQQDYYTKNLFSFGMAIEQKEQLLQEFNLSNRSGNRSAFVVFLVHQARTSLFKRVVSIKEGNNNIAYEVDDLDSSIFKI